MILKIYFTNLHTVYPLKTDSKWSKPTVWIRKIPRAYQLSKLYAHIIVSIYVKPVKTSNFASTVLHEIA
jgi:hypothetical protein